MVSLNQLLLVGVVSVLTIILSLVGIQVIYILRDFRKSVEKVNKILDDAGVASESVVKPIAAFSGFLTGFLSGEKLLQLAKKWLGSKGKQKEKGQDE